MLLSRFKIIVLCVPVKKLNDATPCLANDNVFCKPTTMLNGMFPKKLRILASRAYVLVAMKLNGTEEPRIHATVLCLSNEKVNDVPLSRVKAIAL